MAAVPLVGLVVGTIAALANYSSSSCAYTHALAILEGAPCYQADGALLPSPQLRKLTARTLGSCQQQCV